jgi:hypothetical protein
MTDLRVFRIPTAPADLGDVIDGENMLWQRGTGGRRVIHKDGTQSGGRRDRWYDGTVGLPFDVLVVQVGPLTEAPKAVPDAIFIRYVDDEHITVERGDLDLYSVNHDEHGAAGMRCAVETGQEIAKAFGIDVHTVTGPRP